MPPKNLARELQNLRNSFNPKFVAKRKNMSTQPDSNITTASESTKTVQSRKKVAVRGGKTGRKMRGKGRREPISLQLDPSVDFDTDEEEEGDKNEDANVRESEEGARSDIPDLNVEENEATEIDEIDQIMADLSKKKEEEMKKLKEKEKNKKETTKKKSKVVVEEEENEVAETLNEMSASKEKENSEMNEDSVGTKEKNTEAMEEDETVNTTVEEEGTQNEDEVFEETLDPLFSEPSSKTRSKGKMPVISEEEEENEIPSEQPSTKATKTAKRKGSGSKTRMAKRAKTSKLLSSLEEEDEEILEDKTTTNTCRALAVSSYSDAFKNDVANHLNSLDLPEDTLKTCHGILNCCFHSGRRYRKSWYDSSPAFKYFKEAMYAQGWVNLLDKYSPMYLSEVIQFYATVRVDVASGTLSAVINRKPFVLTIERLAGLLEISDVGLTTFPKRDWGEVEEVTSAQVLKVLRPSATEGPTNIYAIELPAPIRFVFNLVFRNLVPSNNSRGRCSLLDMLLIHHIVKHKPINLPRLIFSRIHEAATGFQNGVFDTTFVVPYGMWLSLVFSAERVVKKGSSAVEKMSDEMSTGSLSRMSMAVVNGVLVKKTQATVGGNVDQKEVLARLNQLAETMGQLVKDVSYLKGAMAELKTMNEDLLERFAS